MKMTLPKISLEQWIIFQTIVQTGSFNKAALTLHRSQSSISYNMAKMQELLGIELFTIKGRKATLSKPGELILKRSLYIVNQLSHLESSISHYKDGSEHQFNILVDELFPVDLLAIILKQFEDIFPSTHVMLINCRETVTEQTLIKLKADCVISRNRLRSDSINILTLECYAYAHPDYELHNSRPSVCTHSLLHQRKIIHDAFSALETNKNGHQCCQWHVDSLSMMIELIASKQGYGWLPSLHADKSHLPLKRLDNMSNKPLKRSLYLSNADPLLISNTQKVFMKILNKIFK